MGPGASISDVPGSNLIFRARAISKTYRVGEVEITALRHVDLDLFQRQFVVLLGPSGSGKSTLLNILGGLDVPGSGSVTFRDHNLTVLDDRALTEYRRDHVGFVFQFYNLIPSLTAIENVALVADISPRPLAPLDALRLVGLENRSEHFPSQRFPLVISSATYGFAIVVVFVAAAISTGIVRRRIDRLDLLGALKAND